MADTWHTWGDAVLASVAALPLAVLVLLALVAGRRRRGWPARAAWLRSVAEVGAVVGTLPWLWMILTPGPVPGRSVNLVPLRELAGQVAGDPGTAVAQIGGNLLVFAALGACAPIRWPALAGPVRLFALGVVASVTVEVAQYLLTIGRVSSVDDVLLNAAGAVLGGLISHRWWSVSRGGVPCEPSDRTPPGQPAEREV